MHVLPMPDGCPLTVVARHVPNLQIGDVTRRYASGAGFSLAAAKESCAMEYAERLSAQVNGDEEIVVATAAHLAGLVIEPPQIMLVDPAQCATASPDIEGLPHPWDPAASIGWVAADRGLSMGSAWLPAGLCFLGHAKDRAAGLLPADSNGLAAGHSPADAAVRAFVELVERDAVAIWWYNRVIRPVLDPADLGDALINVYAAWCAARARVFHLLDLTHDIGLPVVAAISHDDRGGHIALGFGAGSTAAAAARHAIGELSQFECNIALIEQRATATADDRMAPEVRRLLYWWRHENIAGHCFLTAGSGAAPPISVGLLDLTRCHELCHQHGLVFLAIDLTRPMIGTPVVRVVVPGLRSLAPHFAKGRLYEVPARLGWVPRQVQRSDLNPRPLMFGAS